MGIAHFFRAGGWTMYPIALLGLVALPSSITFLLWGIVAEKHERTLAFILIALGLALLVLGFTGYMLGMRMVAAALAVAGPSELDIMAAMGTSESLAPPTFATMAALTTFPAAAALLVAARVRRLQASKVIRRLAPLALGVGTFLVSVAALKYLMESSEGWAARAVIEDESQRAAVIDQADRGRRSAGILALAGVAPIALGLVLAVKRPSA